jgi:20S proteasome subunit beta 1
MATIIAGWDEIDGPQIFTVGMGGTVVKNKFAMAGSGSYLVHGFVDANYRENMTLQQAEDFLTKAVSLAMFKDNSSGGMIRLVNINKDGSTKTIKTHSSNQFNYPTDS